MNPSRFNPRRKSIAWSSHVVIAHQVTAQARERMPDDSFVRARIDPSTTRWRQWVTAMARTPSS